MSTRCKFCMAVLALCVVGAPVFAQPNRGNRGNADPARLIQVEAVKKAVGLSESQLERIKAVVEKAREKRQTAETKAREAYSAEIEKAMSSILTSSQNERLFGIQVQQMGQRAIYNEKVQKAIGLNRAQRAKITAAQEKMQTTFRSMFSGGREGRQKAFETMRAIQEEMKGLLTESQQRRLEAIKGETVEMPRPRFGGGQRPGAGRRPGGGRPQGGRPDGDL
ncbi:MAG: hypothetical protein ACFCD0_00645 [Gemmataceae bacterium]